MSKNTQSIEQLQFNLGCYYQLSRLSILIRLLNCRNSYRLGHSSNLIYKFLPLCPRRRGHKWLAVSVLNNRSSGVVRRPFVCKFPSNYCCSSLKRMGTRSCAFIFFPSFSAGMNSKGNCFTTRRASASRIGAADLAIP